MEYILMSLTRPIEHEIEQGIESYRKKGKKEPTHVFTFEPLKIKTNLKVLVTPQVGKGNIGIGTLNS